MTNMSTIGTGATLLFSAFTGRRIPLIVGWAITNRCNASCSYCQWPQKESEEAPTARALELVAQMAASGTRHIVFSGGEPFLRKDLPEILSACKEKGMFVAVDTNGALVPSRTECLSKIDLVQISLDGPKSIDDEQRGEGSFEKADQAVSVCCEAGVPIAINTTLTRHNLGHVKWLLEYAARHGATVDFQPVHGVHADEETVAPLIPPVEDYRRTIDELAQLKKKGAPVSNSIACLSHLKRFPDPTPIRCSAGKFIVRVDPQHVLFPCNMMRGKRDWPSADSLGFAEAFRQMPQVSCEHCWCSATVEFNLITSGNISAIRNRLRLIRMRRPNS